MLGILVGTTLGVGIVSPIDLGQFNVSRAPSISVPTGPKKVDTVLLKKLNI
jgi:hypothetical protein